MPDNHFHMYYELYYCKTSQCTFFIENQMLEMNAGDFLLIPPRENALYQVYFRYTMCENKYLL